jgi:hypothetical protein
MRANALTQMNNIKTWLFITLNLLVFFQSAIKMSGQTTTSVLNVSSGGYQVFFFNTINEFNNGIIYNSTIRLRIRFEDRDAGNALTTATWKLSVESATPDIGGTGANFLNLNKVELRVESVSVGGTQTAGTNVFFPLTAAYQELVHSGTNDVGFGLPEVEVVLSLQVGVPPNQMAGELEDFYMAFLDFFLEKE